MMRSLTRLLIGTLAFVALTLAGPGARAADYDGADGGFLIYSVGTIAIPMNFTLRYRGLQPRPGSSRPWTDVIECRCVGFFRARMANPDYEGRETGKVVVRRLPPGDYEIHDFGFGGFVGGTTTEFSSRQRFSIPFAIRPGEATYIGNFARAPSLGTPLEPQLGATGFFVISDQSRRDLEIARRRMPDLPAPTISVTDVSSFGHTSLRSTEP